ncbi:MAG TPA: DUF4129 domain-containing protein [Actinomycetes bacterium]|nr:DUF4129 domain-containing protein [Actinomycetes bacterium]
MAPAPRSRHAAAALAVAAGLLLVAAGLLLAGPARADLPAPSRDPDEVRRAVREVLAQPEYRALRRSLPDLVIDWVLQQIGRLVAALSGSGAGSLIGIGILLLVLAGIGVLLVRFSRGMTSDPEAAAAQRTPTGRSAADWRAEAEAHERSGEWRQAVRSRYRALVADLAGRGLVEEVPGRTAGEYRGEVRRNVPAAADDFASATELFELAWYGGQRTGPPEASRLRALAERVLRQAAT